MTFAEWLDIAQESAESELGENVMMLTPEEAVNIYKLVRAQQAYIEAACSFFVALEAALIDEK